MSECPWPGCSKLPTVTVVYPPEDGDAVAAGTNGAPAGRYCPKHAQRVRDGESWELDEAPHNPERVESDVEWISGSATGASDA